LQVANHEGKKNWKKVAQYFSEKSAIQCSARFKRIRPGLRKGKWTQEEDEFIIETVKLAGTNWALIAKKYPHRNGKQIRDRYLNYLDPNVSKENFSKEEDTKLIKLFKIHGSKWSFIAKQMQGRTGDMLKNRFYSFLQNQVFLNTANSALSKHRNSCPNMSLISPVKGNSQEFNDLFKFFGESNEEDMEINSLKPSEQSDTFSTFDNRFNAFNEMMDLSSSLMRNFDDEKEGDLMKLNDDFVGDTVEVNELCLLK